MNEVEAIYGQTDSGMTIIEGNLFLNGQNLSKKERVMV